MWNCLSKQKRKEARTGTKNKFIKIAVHEEEEEEEEDEEILKLMITIKKKNPMNSQEHKGG